MSKFEQIINSGQTTPRKHIKCADGFTLSVQSSEYHYCSPRATDPGPAGYTHVEVGFPSERPEPWDAWSRFMDGGEDTDPTSTVYGYVPVDLVKSTIEAHGGEKK